MKFLKSRNLISLLLCFTLFCSLVPIFPEEVTYASGDNLNKSLSWLKKQFDPPVYPSKLSLSENYSYDYVGHVSGQVDINSLPNYTTKSQPYLQTNYNYVQGYSGEVSGVWNNIDNPENYSIVIYDKTDMDYEIGRASLNSDGTWSAGEKTFHGTPRITLEDKSNNIKAIAEEKPVSEVIKEYEVWIYCVSDIPYLQAKVPISADGSFNTNRPSTYSDSASSTAIGVREGEKVARIVRVSDEKVFGTTEVPKYKLIRSYNVPIDDPVNKLGIDRRSWIYDDALAVFAFSMAGDQGRASSILSTLSQLQNSDGSLAFSYDVYSGPLDERKRSGSIAWVGDSAVKYEETFGDSTYRNFAISIANYLLSQQDKSTGSIKGGPDVNWYSTEHNIDSYFFFRNLGNLTGNSRYLKAASSIENALLTYHWNYSEKRFNQGINDPADALDTSSWGSIFLEAIGRQDLSQTATAYLERFEVNNVPMNLSSNEGTYNMTYQTDTLVSGYKPYNSGYENAPNVVWTEGTWGVINLVTTQATHLHGGFIFSSFSRFSPSHPRLH